VIRVVNPDNKILAQLPGSIEGPEQHVLAGLGLEMARIKSLHALVQLIEAS